ncbi:hypothetical protein EPUS_03876 [Endocarpon pusillum Z07020]|uniref:Uncharacterized protein n=1 Tax=Endocarpon pusillum (strain Z07020 / HMAS-L-300199) TaxID=1263415 RepID=U1GQ16_ENDPU|nr:uncharacterized protein EPUS_03876 [Endocarpon pusillum Z07020]ERF74061.1 hypothetical protein EPUS_03876 [Endocarpon pusillum Z07020]
MAQNGLGRVFLCRSCGREALRPLPLVRSFSSTPQHSKTIPRFSASSTPELDDLFMTFRTKIFTPGALSKPHRDLIYRPTRHKLLLNDPGVTVTMSDEEELRLLPMNIRERPNKKKSLQRLVELLQDERDWQNLPAFLEGMLLADEKLPDGYMERFVRKANEQGRTGLIIRCAEMVRKTGVTLADPAVTTELMLGLHIRAAKAGFKGEDMDKAVRQAQEVLLLLGKPEHCGGRVWRIGQKDMRKDLTVLAIMLELQAAQADRPTTNIAFSRLDTTASKILALFPKEDLTINEDPSQARIQLERLLPLWAGMKLALKKNRLQAPTLRAQMRKDLDALTKFVEEAREKVNAASQGRPRRCLHMYDDLKDL